MYVYVYIKLYKIFQNAATFFFSSIDAVFPINLLQDMQINNVSNRNQVSYN